MARKSAARRPCKTVVTEWIEEAGITEVCQASGLTREDLYALLTDEVDVFAELDKALALTGEAQREALARLGIDLEDLAAEEPDSVETATYDDPSMLYALSCVVRDLDVDLVRPAVELVRSSPAEWFGPGGRWTALLDHPDVLAASMREYVMPLLRGGKP